jgi:polyisoprenoid-binding protein YceI
MYSDNSFHFYRYRIGIAMAPSLLGAMVLSLLGAPARAQVASLYAVDTKASSLTFHVVHKLHRVDGVSRRVEGRARLLPDGHAQVAVRVAADSFDSGNVNRDAHTKEILEPARFPFIELKAAADNLQMPDRFPATVERPFTAQITFHGVEQRLEVPVTMLWESATRVRARASLSLSLDHFKVERPSLMFVKIDDQVTVDADIVFAK